MKINNKSENEIEKVTRTLIAQIREVPEEDIQLILKNLYRMENVQDIVESLGMNADRFFEGDKKVEALELIAGISPQTYSSAEELIEKIANNKSINHKPGNISVEENHRLIREALKDICDKLNDSGVDYYVVGAVAAFIASKTPLFRYHDDIDFMINEKDIEKVRNALEGTEYNFEDNRLNNEKVYTEEVRHAQGGHEVIANHNENEFHLGFWLFRREPDNSLVLREYFMEQQEGKKVPLVLEIRIPQELASLEYSKDKIEFAGTNFRVSTPENIYSKKRHTKGPKDLSDIQVLEDKIDFSKIKQANQYRTTLQVVPADSKDIYR